MIGTAGNNNHYYLNTTMLKSLRATLAAAVIALGSFATVSDADAQMFGDRGREEHMSIGLGGGVNSNFGSGDFETSEFRRGSWHAPEFHVAGEIPVTQGLTLSPRVVYNDFSTRLNNNQEGELSAERSTSMEIRTIGGELLGKVGVVGGLHLLGGAGVNGVFERKMVSGSNSVAEARTSGSYDEMSTTSDVLVSGIVGAGYDIPVIEGSMWVTPEVTYNVPLHGYARNEADGNLRINSLQSKATLKFALPFGE
jgi:hypothetical protein